MAKIDSNMTVSTAVRARSRSYFEQDHVTTQCFLRPMPAFAREKPATRTLFVKHENFSRLDPLPVPTFGRALVYNRAFFVPYRTVWKDWTAFIEQSPVATSKGTTVPPNTPWFNNAELVGLFLQSSMSSAGTSTNYDFAYINTSNVTVYRLFTTQGSYAFKILCSLGYAINWNENDRSTQPALPLLSFCKVIMDWYYPSQYAFSSVFSHIEEIFERQELWTASILGTSAYVQDFIDFFTTACYCSYETDYFASAWDNPVSPNSALFEGAYTINDITVVGNSQDVSNPLGYTPVADPTDASGGHLISQYLIDTLKSLTDYTKRHQLAGVRAVDRYLAEYGINLSAEIMKRSIYCGYYSYPIQFGDVFSHAGTNDERLGDYAGKGQGYGGKTLGYDNPAEFGFFIVMNSIVPQVGFFEGQVKDTMHFYPLDFWHGDFDKQGVQAISQRELYVPMNGSELAGTPSVINQNIFGYIPRYAEYHVGFDRVTGLFRERSKNAGMNSYYLQRVVHSPSTGTGAISHDINFALGSDFQDYNRIFYSGDSVDFITMIHHFEVQCSDELLPLWEDYDFDEHAKSVKMNVGGSSVH